MFYHAPTNAYFREGMPFELDDVSYPANWLNLSTPEEKAALDLVEVITVGERKDDRYYWVSEKLEGAELIITSTPKDLEAVRTLCIANIKAAAYSLLLSSDWMITRKMETGIEVPTEWSTYRDEVRLEAQLQVTQAEHAETVDALAAIQPNWPKSPSDQTQPWSM